MSTDVPTAYDELLDRYARVSALNDASGVLHWDQQVTMPPGGTPARAAQMSAVSAASHEHLTDPETGRLLDALDTFDDSDAPHDSDDHGAFGQLDEGQRAVVREVRRQYERNNEVPDDLIERLTRTQSENQQVWQRAKANDDFASFAPALESLRELHRDRAAHIDADRPAYEVLYEDGEPYLPMETVERIFETLREELVPLIAEIRDAAADLPDPFDGTYDDATQLALCQAALDELGYDRDRGRLDTAPHPFMAGNQFDARVTTRFTPDDPLDALTATIHEFGHATYELGLSQDHYGSPLGQSLSSGVHESQSRFWENHVGRTRAFAERFAPTADEHLGTDVGGDELWQAVNRVYPDNLIRVEADELTYHFHVILRCEIDRAFVAGDLDAEEIPRAWNDKMDEYLGVTPPDDARGCLQDIHWSYGFAGFQGYTIGSVLAAQLNAAVRDDLDVDGLVRDGEYGPIRDWMTEHVHRHGRRYPTDELVEVATGEPLTADYFVAYAREKFTELYDL